MSAAIVSKVIATASVFVQLGIFLYLYLSDPHRVRFFRYLIWSWGFIVVLKGAELTHTLCPECAGSTPVLHAAASACALMVLAAGLAYRHDYQIRWPHAGLGIALVLASALWGTPAAEGIAAFPWRALTCGGLVIVGGLAFWPRRSVRPAPLGARFLAISLVLWGLHRIVLLFLPIRPDTGHAMAADVSFIFLYLLTVFATIILVRDRARAGVEALQDFNERLVDGLGEGLVLVDGTFTLRFANQWMAQQFGPVLGRHCYEVLTADGRQCPGCPMADRSHMDAPVRLEIGGPDERRFRLTCSPVRQPDGQIFLLELVADVTEQERLRARLIEAEQLAAAGELAAGVAHEIRNPLSAIVNAATLLEREALLSSDERASTLEAVKKEARRLNATLSDFLSFARPQEPKHVVGDIREVVGHVATLLREEGGALSCVSGGSGTGRPKPAADTVAGKRAPAGGVQVEVQVEPGVPCFVFDPDQLTQVLWNIALNGIEAMAGQGRLRFEAGRQDGEVWIAISDTGPGIPPEEQRRVFQPFFSKRPGGTGLGLAIARRIVVAHAGHIDLESAPGQGSRFTIRLPLRGA